MTRSKSVQTVATPSDLHPSISFALRRRWTGCVYYENIETTVVLFDRTAGVCVFKCAYRLQLDSPDGKKTWALIDNISL